jgi:hypothetical protein
VITGVVVAGLAARGQHPTLSDLGVSWAIAVAVSLLWGEGFALQRRSSRPMKGKQTEVRLWAPKARHQRRSATRTVGARGSAGAGSLRE